MIGRAQLDLARGPGPWLPALLGFHKAGQQYTETTINNTRDFGIGKRLTNMPALPEVGFSATRRLVSARAALPPDSPATRLLQQVGSDIGAVVAELRLITGCLRPATLDQLGLAGAVRELVTRLSSPTFRVHVYLTPDSPGLPAAVEVAIYRILAEALANVINHAGAGNASVKIEVDEETVSIDVINDGTGLPAKPRSDGIGLASMRERTQEIGG